MLIGGKWGRVIARVRSVLSGFVAVRRLEGREVRILSRCTWECRGPSTILFDFGGQGEWITRFVFWFLFDGGCNPRKSGGLRAEISMSGW